MRQTIAPSKHRGGSWLDRLPWFFSREWSREVTFHASCRYELSAPDQYDYNKLGGRCFGLSGPHGTSARFGFRYNAKLDGIDLVAYTYVRGERYWHKTEWPWLGWVPLERKVRVAFRAEDDHFIYMVDSGDQVQAMVRVPHDLTPWERRFGLSEGLFFGGNRTLQHRLEITVRYLRGWRKWVDKIFA